MWRKNNPRKTLCGNYVEIKIANFAKSTVLKKHAKAFSKEFNHVGSVAPQFTFYQTQTMWILCGNELNDIEASSQRIDHSVKNLTN